ncbi:hypothetical protein V8F20_004945 [Naviculisporaceae sp. PSN 640]
MEQHNPQALFSAEDKLSELLYEHITTLQAKVASLESRATGHHARHDSITGRTEMTDDGLDSDQGPIKQLTNSNTIFEARYCNLTQFKNRFSEDDGRYALDVLISGPLLGQEIREEIKLREQRAGYGSHWEQYQQLQKQQSTGVRKSAFKAKTNVFKTAADISTSNSDAIRAAQSSDTWIRRVRLQSPALLKIMASVQGETWSFRPRTYFRPFSSLIYFHPQMTKRLADLEERWSHFISADGSVIPFSATNTTSSDPSSPSREGHPESYQEPVDNSPLALLAMRCYISFMETKIMPEYRRFEHLDEKDAAKLGPATQIRFSDLGHLFRTGEFVYRDLDSDTPGRRDSRLGKRLWRCYGLHAADTRLSVTQGDHRKYDGPAAAEDEFQHGQYGDGTSTTSSTSPSGNSPATRTPNQNAPFNPHAFVIRAYMVEYTGDGFCTVTKDFSILPYKGLKQITTLPIYPLRFAPGGSDTSSETSFLSTAIKVGDQVLHSIRVKHGTYNAWTVMRTPEATLVRDANGVLMKHPEHVNSEVLVDFAEAFQVCPAWKPRRVVLRRRNVEQVTESDEFSILWWDGPDRNKLLGETSEVVPIRTGVGMWAQNHFVSEGDDFLRQLADNESRGLQTGWMFLRPEDKALISPRIYAYVFQERKFAQLDVRYFVDSVGANKEALNSLRIPLKDKSIILRSVRGHLIQKEKKRLGTSQSHTSQDFIRGKGSGLFILLHGVPGVGKTATAEAVAQTLCKPLFKITCGDLGLTPEQVELSLTRIFRLASLWDTILLLDEVDTFFSQRSKGDGAITKNALVSVFLRILDYYPGILFMTTNRAGALDEAFKSRIHYQIYYGPLNKKQTLEIWEISLDRLQKLEEDDQQQCNARRDPQGDTMENPDLDHGHRSALSTTRAPHKPMLIPKGDILRWAAMQFDNSRKKLNGRQIRNAIQVAKALAYADAETAAELAHERDNESGTHIIIPAPRLKVEHFETIQELTDEFDDYMRKVYSEMDDARLAAEKEERFDAYTQRPPSAMGRMQGHGEHPSATYEDDGVFADGSSPPSRSHSQSRGRPQVGPGMGVTMNAQMGVHGGMAPARSPVRAVSNSQGYGRSGSNWSAAPKLVVPYSGGGNQRQQQVLLQQQQQQRQYQYKQPASLSPPSPSMPHTQFRGTRQYASSHIDQGIVDETLDNGPLPGQTRGRQMGFMGSATSNNGSLPDQVQQRQAAIDIPQKGQPYEHQDGSLESQGEES